MEERNESGSKVKKLGFWKWALASIIFRLILSYISESLNLSTRPEVSTPITSLRRCNLNLSTRPEVSSADMLVGDSALYLSLLGLFVNELAEMQFSFFLFCGYVGVSLLSPVMHNLWIWRGTGNANFYFATAMAYACFQIILVVESVSTMLNYDRKLRKLSITAKV